jgi:gliding motility-associated-like protein
MKHFFHSLLFLLPFHLFGAIEMKCISTGTAGDVTVNWNNTSSSALFRSYHIYHSTSAPGPFTLIDSVNIYGNQYYSDPVANAGTINAFYYVVLYNTNGTTNTSDTIQAMRLTVIDPGNGYASLSWNKSHTPLIATNSVYHLIYQEYPAGVFTLIDSVNVSSNAPSYLDEVVICGDTLNYRIEVSDASGCKSISNVSGEYFTDRIAPSTPQIDSVSIGMSGNALLGWSPSSSSDTYGYIIYYSDGSSTIAIDTVYGINNTFYQSSLDALAGVQGFRVVAFDSCGNPCGAEPLQQTIFLQGALQICSGSIYLTWSSYVNSSTAPTYNIYKSENGGLDVFVASTQSTSFTVPGLKTDTFYCFHVVAQVNGPGSTSTSNNVCVTPDLPITPMYSYISRASVFPNDVVEITAYVDPVADIMEYSLQRATSLTGNYVTVQTQPSTGISPITFTDAVSTDEINYYRVASVDSCGNDALPSQVSRTISVDTISSDFFQNAFSWNTYSGWQYVSRYEIFRSIDGITDPLPLSTLSSTDSAYVDDVSNLYYTEGNFCYYVVAYELGSNPFGFSDSSRSNEVCFRQKTGVFIPNAFRPGGVNGVFNPAEHFIGSAGYSLQIYNRFGEVIFETDDPLTGWDGTAKGHNCESGVYVYRFRALDEKGNEILRTSRVTLIR